MGVGMHVLITILALWCAGHVAIVQHWPELGMALVLANPLMPMFFLHFALQFVADGQRTDRLQRYWQRWKLPLYAVTLLLIASSWYWRGGGVASTAGFNAFFVFVVVFDGVYQPLFFLRSTSI